MKSVKHLFPVFTHLLFALAGFAAGIYLLPIITAPESPTDTEILSITSHSLFKGEMKRDIKGSDFLHWGEGQIFVGKDFIALEGKIAPGPDYKLYLTPELAEDGNQFQGIKSRSIRVGDIKTFENFIVPVPPDVEPEKYNSVIIWCESFEQFISAARYQ